MTKQSVYGGCGTGASWGVVLRGWHVVLSTASAAEVNALGTRLAELAERFEIPLAVVIGCDDPADAWDAESSSLGAGAAVGVPLCATRSDAAVERLEEGLNDDDIAMSEGAHVAERLAQPIPDALTAELMTMFPEVGGPVQRLLWVGGWTAASLHLPGETLSASAEIGEPTPIDAPLDGGIQLEVQDYI